MLHTIANVLTPDELNRIRGILTAATWGDGRATAGYQSMVVKRNLQLAVDNPQAIELGKIVVQAVTRNNSFNGTVLPQFLFPPLFNRYDVGMGFGNHIDNAIRGSLAGQGGRLRTDVSATLFLSDPADYDGGDLVIEGAYGAQRIKLPAGHLVLYPATSVHRIETVTRGTRLASFFWIQSMVRDETKRALLHDLDVALGALRQRGLGNEPELIALNGVYHNLIRRWATL